MYKKFFYALVFVFILSYVSLNFSKANDLKADEKPEKYETLLKKYEKELKQVHQAF